MPDERKNVFSTKRALVLVGIVILLALSGVFFYLQRSKPAIFNPENRTATPVVSGDDRTPTPEGQKFGIDLQLKDGKPEAQPSETRPLAAGEPLSPEEIDLILARLPALPPDDQTGFNRPAELLPPPRPGNTIQESFPPLETEPTPGVVESGPLQVLRFAPEGEIPIAPFVSVTFNQPMVPLGTLEDLAAEDVPVQIEPALEGTWRWLGTKTLTFEYDSELIDRLPKATEYVVTVPAGITSAGGQTLAETVTWKFKTPPPKVITTYPYDTPQPLDPLFFIAFDQRVDPVAVLRTIQVTAEGRPVEVRQADQAEIDADEGVKQLAENAEAGRWLAFRAAAPFTPETNIAVSIGPGTPSAEGPLTTTETQSYSFSTYAPLRIVNHECSWYDDRCPPLTPFYIRFNNSLDTNVFDEGLLRIDPEIPGLSVNVYGNSLEISGETRGRTTYTVTVSGKIQDTFGQQLGEDTRLTFKVDKAEPILVGSRQNFVTLDPTASEAIYSVYAMNYSRLNLKIYAVQPGDWPAFTQYLRDWRQTDNPPGMPGILVSDNPLGLDMPPDTLTQVDINLEKYMNGDFGHFVVVVEPPAGIFESQDDKWRRYSQTVITWVQITQIGLDAYTDHSEMVAWATDLKNGAPLQGVSIQPGNGNSTHLTGADGVARFPIPSGAKYLVARQGSDQAILPRSTYYWGDDAWAAYPPVDTLRWYVFDDRQMYRPGEEIHVKGWLRRIGEKQNGDVGLVGSEVTSVGYRINDPQGNSLGEGQAEVNALGGFDFALTLPQATNLGTAYISLTASGSLGALNGTSYTHQFQIQEFRRPEFEVAVRNETTGPYFAGDEATLAVEAKYYAGGGLPNAEVTWQVNTTPGSYSPPNWPDFTFGNWQPWWWFYDEGYPYNSEGTQTETFTGRTDATGTHYLGMQFIQQGDLGTDPQPQSVMAQATVMDVNRQAWSSSTTLLVHPADLYIGLRTERYFVARGTPLKVDFIVTDLDGNAIADRPVEIRAGRLEWKTRKGEWVEEETDSQVCTFASALEPATCTFETPLGGSYRITAQVTDEFGRKNQSRITRWVSGGQRPPSRKVEQEQVTLIPDKETYQPGDTAEILVQSPFSPAEGLLTVSRSGILYTTRFTIEEGSTTLRIPIEEEHIPNLNIQVDLVGASPRTDDRGEPLPNVPPRPAYATAQLNLNIPPLQRTLSLQVSPEQTSLEPGGNTTLTVMVKDADGFPVPDAELAVVVVDEAVLALTDYQMRDPLDVFYADRSSYLSAVYARASIVLADPQALAREAQQNAGKDKVLAGGTAPAATEAPAMEEGAWDRDSMSEDEQAQPSIDVRSDFNPLATFAPAVRTGPTGEARVLIELPDNLTRYRIMAVAVDKGGNRFGMDESNITARLPLMVRPSAPRFLNFGDRFELPVVLQNQTDETMVVNIAARATNLELANAGLRVIVPANDRVEVRFAASTVMAGTTRIQFAATSGDYADAATVELPVYTPA
ncbi:MAG: Ig-like domain-containing protein, partial [Anaerolineales bacterium]